MADRVEAEEESKRIGPAGLGPADDIAQIRQRAQGIRTNEVLEERTKELAQALLIVRATLESTTDAILVTDEETKVIDFNKKFIDMWRFPREVLKCGTLRAVLELASHRFADPNRFIARIEEILVTKRESFDLLELKDGRILEGYSKALTIEGRGAAGRVWSFRDVTERHLADMTSRRLAAIVTSSDDAMIGKDLNSIITSWNFGAERIFGYTADEMIGTSIMRLIPPDRREEEREILSRIQRGERFDHFETLRLAKDGRKLNVSITVSPIQDSTGRLVGASKVVRNITERKEAEAAIQHAHEQLREHTAVLEQAPVLVRDLDSRIVLWTRGAERLYGFSKEEALGRISHELFQTEFPESLTHVEEILSRDGRWEGELVHRKRNGERLVVASQQIIYNDPSGRPVRILEANADITERKRAEAELSYSQERLRALAERLRRAREEEAARIARELHDQFGRYLTIIKMDVRSIERDLAGALTLEVAHDLREKAKRIGQTVDETVHIVREIATQLRPGLLDDLGLAAAIEWQAKDFQKRSGISCTLRVPEEDLNISRDQATALFRIFQEILTNVMRHARATKVWGYLDETNAEIVLEVEDNGVGISLAQMAERRSLGLLGMRERAAEFGGAIEIAGVPRDGTTVIVRMPASRIEGENSVR